MVGRPEAANDAASSRLSGVSPPTDGATAMTPPVASRPPTSATVRNVSIDSASPRSTSRARSPASLRSATLRMRGSNCPSASATRIPRISPATALPATIALEGIDRDLEAVIEPTWKICWSRPLAASLQPGFGRSHRRSALTVQFRGRALKLLPLGRDPGRDQLVHVGLQPSPCLRRGTAARVRELHIGSVERREPERAAETRSRHAATELGGGRGRDLGIDEVTTGQLVDRPRFGRWLWQSGLGAEGHRRVLLVHAGGRRRAGEPLVGERHSQHGHQHDADQHHPPAGGKHPHRSSKRETRLHGSLGVDDLPTVPAAQCVDDHCRARATALNPVTR